jgi:hypothetical protein
MFNLSSSHGKDPHHGHAKGIKRLADMGPDDAEAGILTVARHFCATFACPESQSWSHALTIAQERFADQGGTALGMAVFDMVQALRMSRQAGFHFSDPLCMNCRLRVTRDEQNLLGLVQALRRGRQSDVAAHAMILCEGNDTAPLIAAAVRLICRLPKPVEA